MACFGANTTQWRKFQHFTIVIYDTTQLQSYSGQGAWVFNDRVDNIGPGLIPGQDKTLWQISAIKQIFDVTNSQILKNSLLAWFKPEKYLCW